MRCTRLFSAFTALLVTASLGAQDVHFTLHDYAPLWLNPAQTGAYSGSVRVGGIFRGQWDGLSSIRSPSAFADAPIVKGLTEGDWIGAGALLTNDNAGPNDLKQNFFGFSAAYHYAFDEDRRNVLTLGAQYGSVSYSFETDPDLTIVQEQTIDEELGGQAGEPEVFQVGSGGGLPGGGENNDNSSQSFNDINAGLMLRSVLDPKKDNLLEVGISLLHLNTADRRSLLERNTGMGMDSTMVPPSTPGGGNSEEDRERKATLHAHARLDMQMSQNWRFQPTLFYQASAGTSSLSLQAWGGRNLRDDVQVRAGLGYRTGDAVKLMAGLDYGQLRAALSFDFIRLAGEGIQTVNQSAFEVTANYIFNIYKKPEVTPTMLCPRI